MGDLRSFVGLLDRLRLDSEIPSVHLHGPADHEVRLRSRRMDLVPEGTEKCVQAPNVHFFDREYRGYSNFLDPTSPPLVDCQDSFIQAIDIAFRLGFRTMFLGGVNSSSDHPSSKFTPLSKPVWSTTGGKV